MNRMRTRAWGQDPMRRQNHEVVDAKGVGERGCAARNPIRQSAGTDRASFALLTPARSIALNVNRWLQLQKKLRTGWSVNFSRQSKSAFHNPTSSAQLRASSSCRDLLRHEKIGPAPQAHPAISSDRPTDTARASSNCFLITGRALSTGKHALDEILERHLSMQEHLICARDKIESAGANHGFRADAPRRKRRLDG